MSKVIDAPAESSTAPIDINEGFTEFQEEQRAARNTSGLETETSPEEHAPGSEPVIGAETVIPPAKPKQELTPEEIKLREQKRNSNERRHAERERELNAAKAEIERLKAGKAAPAESATATSTVVPDPKDPQPKQDLDPSTGKPYEDFDKYLRDSARWNARQVLNEEREIQAKATAETQVKAQADTFMGNIGEYAKTHQGFMGTPEEPGAFEIVRDELEDGLQEVSSAIVEHDKPAELIDYLGTHPDALDKILAHRGNPVKALIELGRIIATEFEPPEAPVAATPQRRTLPKPPAAVTGRGHTPSGEAALDAAAEANDFTAFQKIQRERERKR